VALVVAELYPPLLPGHGFERGPLLAAKAGHRNPDFLLRRVLLASCTADFANVLLGSL
jgi:hypothetical protein